MKNIRYYIFWILDFILKKNISKNYKEIEEVYFDTTKRDFIQSKRLNEILIYAMDHTKFYGKEFSSEKINTFPVINKKIIMNNYSEMFSDEFIDNKKNLRVMTTSGSSGTPFKIHQNHSKIVRNRADLLFFYKLGGYDIGDRLYYLRIWNSMNKKGRLLALKENLRMYDTSNLGKEGAEQFKRKMLNDRAKKNILGYASSFIALMNYFKKDENVNWNIKSIITGAEELPISVKLKMMDVFRCPVVSRYSNQENGILAQQPISGEHYFELNEGSYFFEFLKIDNNEPAAEREICRIVITDFFNKAVPMIRYDTGDLCTYEYKEGRRIITSIEGRKTDFLRDINGNLLSPKVISVLMWKYKSILEYQYVQYSLNMAELKLSHRYTVDKEQVFEDINHEIKGIFGDYFNLKIVEMDEIKVEKSGKRKYIISYV